MPYIIHDDNNYLIQNKQGKWSVVDNIKCATRWDSFEKANNVLNQNCKQIEKLKNFNWEIKDISQDGEGIELVKDKRRTFTTKERTIIYNRNKGRCAICGDFVPYDEFTVDHIIPLSKGGTNDLKNLQCACKTCNLVKQDILPKDLMDKLTQIVLYQMRRNYNKSVWKKMKRLHKQYSRYRIKKVVSSLKVK